MRRVLLASAAVSLMAVGLGWGALRAYTAPGPLAEPATVIVPRGGTASVAAGLARAGVVRSALSFRIAAAVTSAAGPLRAAEFAVPARASLAEVLAILRGAPPVLHRFTIAEGLTSAQVAGLLAAADWLTGETVVPREGSLLPQTYALERGAKRQAVVAEAQAAQRTALAAAWAGRAPGLPLRTPEQAVILASMVERETGIAAERPMVAQVFYNRLRLHMRLQSDPTALYGASGGQGVLPRALTAGDLARAGPYNTYSVAGLPAAPVCNPGLAAIEAVLHPAATAALYFVADGTGGHRFAFGLEEHNRNVARARDAAGR